MKLQFTHKAYQTAAVDAVVGCFAGQTYQSGKSYILDPGKREEAEEGGQSAEMELETSGLRNASLDPGLPVLENVQGIQRQQNLTLSGSLVRTKNSQINLDVEMETGTGKTYVYIKTMFELQKRYGWNKFIIVVPSIAIREGVQKSLEVTAEHFLQDYGQRARFFTYNSSDLHNLENFSTGSGLQVMIINVQAFSSAPAATASPRTIFNQKNKIYRELDGFQSRRPIDVLKANQPILILDEPQKMEGPKTTKALAEFDPLFVLRYSATHKTEHNKVHRLDALDAYNQKLVKKIAVRGITMKNLAGTSGYLFLEAIQISKSAPVARMEIEVKTKTGTKRVLRKIKKGDDLFSLSNEMRQYQDRFVVKDIDAHHDTVHFTNGIVISAGEAIGAINEAALRRIQIRETIRAHFEREEELFYQGIKVLSLFFIDSVAKYRSYDEAGDAVAGEYAEIFEEEYLRQLNEVLELSEAPYQKYLKGIDTGRTHNGYFSIDKKGKLTDPKMKASGEDKGLTDDVSAYDLILKDKERLLSFEEPVRFIFSHSALREGWDNPNVFTICTLKHSESHISKRQEVGRGMRLCVNQSGERMDDPQTAHQTNVLTVVASESYQDFAKGLQADIAATLSFRARAGTPDYFCGKTIIPNAGGEFTIDDDTSREIFVYLRSNGYVDKQGHVTNVYHEAKAAGTLEGFPEDLAPYEDGILELIDALFSEKALASLTSDGRKEKANPLNANFHKKEFQDLWGKINQKAIYQVDFCTEELIKNSIKALDGELNVPALEFRVTKGGFKDELDFDEMKHGQAGVVKEEWTERETQAVVSRVPYDLVGDVASLAQLTRRTAGRILSGMNVARFGQYKRNPEAFIRETVRLIKEQKSTLVVQHLSYHPLEDRHDSSIFTQEKTYPDFSRAFRAKDHVYDYVFTDSKGEREFAEHLDASREVTVYAKLPSGFAIPTPMGNYNPDWAIAFEEKKVKHIFFIAETKGDMSTLQLKPIEEAKKQCARKFFAKISSEQVRYDVVDSYDKLMALVL